MGEIPEPWKAIMTQLVPEAHIPYKVRMNLITEVSKPTVDDQVPEVRDSHEASQDQAEEASDEKDKKRTEVKPVASTSFSFSTTDSEFHPETGQYASMKLRCQICALSKRYVHMAHFEADSMYSLSNHMQKVHAVVVCPSTKSYTDQQLIAGRAIQASFSWLNRERDEVGTHKRRLTRSGPSLTDAITPDPMADEELDLNQQAGVLPLSFVAQYEEMYVRPEHPTTSRSMTFNDQATDRLPFCSDVLHQ